MSRPIAPLIDKAASDNEVLTHEGLDRLKTRTD